MPPNDWTREQLLVALTLYWQIPFGRFDQHNPEVISYSKLIGRSPSALAMRLSNGASLDPAITSTGRTGLAGISNAARALWEEVHQDWEWFATESEQAAVALGIADSPAEIDETTIDIPNFVGGERAAQVMVRIGQNLFRSTVLSAYRNQCCITGLTTPSLLIASHIVP
jgi:putative restriction endonuclease